MSEALRILASISLPMARAEFRHNGFFGNAPRKEVALAYEGLVALAAVDVELLELVVADWLGDELAFVRAKR